MSSAIPTAASSLEITMDVWKKWNIEAEYRFKNQKEYASVPKLDHLTMKDYNEIYEPSDDTFLLLDAIRYDLLYPTSSSTSATRTTTTTAAATAAKTARTILEIGCGSGVASIYCTLQLKALLQQQQQQQKQLLPSSSSSSILLYLTDINPNALRAAQRTALANGISLPSRRTTTKTKKTPTSDNDHDHGREHKNDENNNNNHYHTNPIHVEAIECDLISSLLPRMNGMMDIVIFNPPYVPTPDEEIPSLSSRMFGRGGANDDDYLPASWAGGERGRRIIDRAIPQMMQILSFPNGIGYMVTVDENEPYELAQQLKQQYHICMKPLLRRKARNESLTIQKITWIV